MLTWENVLGKRNNAEISHWNQFENQQMHVSKIPRVQSWSDGSDGSCQLGAMRDQNLLLIRSQINLMNLIRSLDKSAQYRERAFDQFSLTSNDSPQGSDDEDHQAKLPITRKIVSRNCISPKNIPIPFLKYCKVDDCKRLAISGGTPMCGAHGGGRRCQFPACEKPIRRGGNVPFCIAHGGGKRCQDPTCDKAAESGGAPYCIAHGGGKRCQFPSCSKGAQSGGAPFCKVHGGGKRCLFPSCGKSAVGGSSMYCKRHGGGKRCTFPGCDKGAQSGGAPLCRVHGGGKRCSELSCSLPVVSGTQFCTTHANSEARKEDSKAILNLVKEMPAIETRRL